MRKGMERMAAPGSGVVVFMVVSEVVAFTGFAAWVAVTRPHHLVGGVATVLCFTGFSVLASVQIGAATGRGRGAATGAPVDADAELGRVQRAVDRLGTDAQLGDARVVAQPRMPLVLRLRRTPQGSLVLVNPHAVAGRDDAALQGMLALQVVMQRHLRPRVLVAVFMVLLMVTLFVVPLVIAAVLTGDVLLSWALAGGVASLLWMIVAVPFYLRLFGARQMARVDAEASRIAGSPAPVARALEATAENERSARQDAARRRTPLLWPAKLFLGAAARWSDAAREQRIAALRRGDVSSA